MSVPTVLIACTAAHRDTGVFDADRYFDVFVEYAKAGPEDILIRVTAASVSPGDLAIYNSAGVSATAPTRIRNASVIS